MAGGVAMDLDPAVRDDILLKKDACGIYVGPADLLNVLSWNSLGTVTQITLSGRFLNLQGKVVSFSERHVPNTDRSFAVSTHQLGEGWLLSLQCVSNSNPLIGQTFIRAAVTRSSGTPSTTHITLLQGFVGLFQALAWPGSPLVNTISQPGAIRVVTGTDPAAGAECSDAVPTGARWRILSYTATFVADATVINRFPIITIDDGANIQYRGESAEAVTASQTRIFHAAPGTHRLALVNSHETWLFPIGLRMLAGHRVRTQTNNLQAGDNWGAPQILVEEWLEAKA
jgi:hypothetical protein